MAAPDFIAYHAYGIIVKMTKNDQFSVYFPDFSDETTKELWEKGQIDANDHPKLIIPINLNNSAANVKAKGGDVKTVADFVGSANGKTLTRLQSTAAADALLGGRVCLAERHWNALTPKPLPAHIDERRVRVNLYYDTGAKKWTGYHGFVAKVTGKTEQGGKTLYDLEFKDWMNGSLGSATGVDLTDTTVFDGETKVEGDLAYTFVKLDLLGDPTREYEFLQLGKVPWGGGKGE